MTAGEIIKVLKAFEEDKEVEVYEIGMIYNKIDRIELQDNPIDKKTHLVFITGKRTLLKC